MLVRSSLLVSVLALSAGCGGGNKCASEPSTPPTTSSAAPTAPTASAAPPPAPTGTKVDVPIAPGGGADSTLRVEIQKDGTMSIEGARLNDPRELTDRTKASARVRPDLQVVIVADRDVPYANVVNAVDLVKLAGVSRIAFAVEQAAPMAPPSARPEAVPTLEPGEAWKCHFEGHIDDLPKKSVFVAIHVGPDGKPQTVDVLEDPAPGSGLGEAARTCAMNHSFRPAKDTSGKPVPGVMKLRVFFQSGHTH